jgi:hypothetical protein
MKNHTCFYCITQEYRYAAPATYESRYMIKKISFLIILLLFQLTNIAMPQPSMAQTSQSDIPLMVVRFNQARVYYDKQLFNVASKALKIKPDVMFSVVSFVPAIGSEEQQEEIEKHAARQTSKFIADLKGMGVPAGQINLSKEKATDSKFHELYLYVD